MRVVACLGFLSLCLALVGCTSLGKKTSLPKSPRDDRPSPSSPPNDHLPLPPSPTASVGDTGGLVAGTVIDYFNNKTPARIWAVAASDGPGAPVYQYAETNDKGQFSIAHLRPGQPYRLIAQTKDGTYKQGGEVTVRPPNARVVIQVSQDRAPAIPGGETEPAARIEQPTPLPGAPGADPRPAADIRAPVPIRPDTFAGPTRDPRTVSPIGSIPGPGGSFPPRLIPKPPGSPKPTPPAPSSGGGPALPEPALAPISATEVPSCDLRGKQLYNFCLADLDGQPWEYRRDRRPGTKLVLLDFWATWCGPCRDSIARHLVPLNELYGRQGLEVIGIAYEKEPTFAAQVRTVSAWAPHLGIKYRVLMGAGMTTCPVMRDFGVQGYPSLVLLDEKGQIIWRKEGLPSDADVEYLKVEIRKGLGLQRRPEVGG